MHRFLSPEAAACFDGVTTTQVRSDLAAMLTSKWPPPEWVMRFADLDVPKVPPHSPGNSFEAGLRFIADQAGDPASADDLVVPGGPLNRAPEYLVEQVATAIYEAHPARKTFAELRPVLKPRWLRRARAALVIPASEDGRAREILELLLDATRRAERTRIAELLRERAVQLHNEASPDLEDLADQLDPKD